MLKSINVTGIAYDIEDQTHKYILKKIGKLDKFLPGHARKTATADIRIKKIDSRKVEKFIAEVSIEVPDKTILAKSSSANVISLIDDVEAKLATQLRKYKQATLPHLGRRRILSEFKRSYSREL